MHDGGPSALEILRIHGPKHGGGDDGGGSMGGDDPEEGLRAATEDLFAAMKSGDTDAGMRALKSAFALCDSQPHEEGEQEDGGGMDGYAHGGAVQSMPSRMQPKAGMGSMPKSERRQPMPFAPKSARSVNPGRPSGLMFGNDSRRR